ncbi:COG3014 family protein [Facilibium subflavum]|uniref:COG3014 family protein n=1 Tax=Facilibium subflavum TaxID=2219058 RepID=UPI000E649B36|nr:hypothetical protein [Facilibium subflavum]
MHINKIIKGNSLLFVVIFFLLLSGCATFSKSYPAQMAPVKTAMEKNNIKEAQKKLDENIGKTPTTLGLLEKARLAQLDNNFELSKKYYASVIDMVATSKMAAKIQASKILENFGAVLTNDRELSYHIPDYAMTFLYPYQALNYLAQHDLSGALVAIRQLSNAQYWSYQQRLMAGELQSKYQKQTSKAGIDEDKLGLKKSKEISAMFDQAKQINNAYENGFAYYLSSILYEAFDDNYNNAFVSIKKARQLLPDNKYVNQTYQEMQKGFDGGSAYQKNHGRLVVIYEQGFVQPKLAFKLPLFLGKLGLQEVAVPYYPTKYTLLPQVSISVTQQNKIIHNAPSAILVDTTKMALKSLSEEYPAIITREVIRLVIKSLATLEASNQAGGWGLLVGSIYSFATAQADERSWLLLPNNVQLYESQLQAGDYHINIQAQNFPVTIKSQKTTLLWLVDAGGFLKPFTFIL